MVDGVRTTHHVKIGDHHYLVKPGTYRKRPAPLFGPRFTSGDPDYNTLSVWQHWVQKCWIGGMGAEEWQDDAMYDEGVGVDTSQHEVMMLTRDLSYPTGAGNGRMDSEKSAREFIVFNGTLYCLSYGTLSPLVPSKLWKWDVSTYTWVRTHTFNNPTRSAAVFNNRLYIGDGGSDINYTADGTNFTAVPKPSGITDTPYAMQAFRGRLYVGFGKQIWRLKTDNTWDGSTAFYTAEDANYIIRMETHLGFLYMASQNGRILRTDGNATFDLWSFETGFVIAGMRSFDGRLFISVNEPLDGTTAQQAVLYQFSGAAVTELKRWGKAGQDISTGRLRVIGHRLFFGAGGLLGMGDGFGVAVYDAREDAYSMWSTNRDTVTFPGGTEGVDWTVDDVIFYGGHVFASVRKYGVLNTKLSFKDASRLLATYDTTPAGASSGSGNGGWITSSDFDAGTPGLQKMWNAMILDYDLPDASCSIYVEYSLDGGRTWTHAKTLTKGTPVRYTTEIQLPDSVRGGRFKWKLTLRTTNTTRSPFVRGVTVRYLPIPEPNWMWDMVLVLSERQELLDGTIQLPDNATKLAALRSNFRSQSLVHFREPDGTDWATNATGGTVIYSMEERLPNIDATTKGALELEVPITLLETVQAYEVP